MIESPVIVIVNTYGILILVVFVILYEFFVARSMEVAWHVIFSVSAAVVFSVVLKELFLVPRPYLTEGGYPQAGLAYLSSLPSVHAVVSFCLATTVTLHRRPLGVFLFTVAALLSIGRVIANVHYPGDVIVGMLIGVLTGIIFNQIHIKLRKGVGRRG